MCLTLFVFGLVLFLSSCATPQYSNNVQSLEPGAEGSSSEISSKAEQMDWDRTYPVEVSVRKLPSGLSWNKDGRLTSTSKKYQVLGHVTSSRKESEWDALGKSVYFYINMHDKHSGFRDGYCKVQMPLRYLTALLWSLTPFNWPCFGWHSDDESAYQTHLQDLKRLSFAMGGTHLYIKDHDTNKYIEGWVVK